MMPSSLQTRPLSWRPRKRSRPLQLVSPAFSTESLAFTDHATRRSRTRNVPTNVVPIVMAYGQSWRQADGRVAYFVGKRQVAQAAQWRIDLAAVLHVAVVVADDGAVLTVVRTDDPKRIKRIAFASRRRLRSPKR